jgi:hypothetical protein
MRDIAGERHHVSYSLKDWELTGPGGRVLRTPALSTSRAVWESALTARNVVVGNLRPFRAADRLLKPYGRVTGGRAASRPEAGESER